MAKSVFINPSKPCQSKFSRNCLILSIVFFILAALLFSRCCYADARLEVYGLFHCDDLGYDPGPGARLETGYRWRNTEAAAYGQYALIHKIGHNEGYHYWYGGGLRQYVYDDFFVGAGYVWRGYESKGGGECWKKDGDNVTAQAGYDTPAWALMVEYAAPTDAGATAISVTGKVAIPGEPVVAYFRSSQARFRQSGVIMTGQALEMGAGYRF